MDPPQETPSPEYWDRGLGSQNPTGYEVGRERILSHKSEFPATGICKLTFPPSYEVFNDLAETPGVEIRIKHRARDPMHLKCYQIDGKLLRTGAANFSASGLKRQDNDLIVIESTDAAASFKRNFDAQFASGEVLAASARQ
jgi:phosphatidylserine/phosphatidylglycerophosphate/cardiolipin synthase-like enzyme